MQAQKPIDESTLDPNKIKVLSQYSELIKSLSAWITVPDGKLMPQLVLLGNVVERLYGIGNSLMVFRGFNLDPAQQNCMGLDKVNPLDVGHKFQHPIEKYPLSFSTDENIAKMFGRCVIRVDLDKTKLDYLDITDELAFLVCQARNIAPVTQNEVIVFPPESVDCEVIHYRKRPNPSWVMW